MARIALRRGRREPRETGENEPARPSELETAGGELAPRERREPARRREKLLIFSTEGQVPDAGASEMNSNGDAGGGDGRNRWCGRWCWRWLVVRWVVVVRRMGGSEHKDGDVIGYQSYGLYAKRGSQAEPLVFGVGLAGGADCAAEPGRCHSAPNFRSEGTVHVCTAPRPRCCV
ncbi:hypothetical protein, variant 3 [Blastomyces dermatitidis ATCC 26199]|nr:hypothetical protein BDFG_08972 [Blastomyces dermatitidis ATCC 26199]EQL28284.1 hypothetical protein, variant 1 [Blastomyces dermatitidis ATCC 26199]EQL28285.1 hypothetical protein, variant 2 [Blastomyces dermatitidis ATCC 26199]EQL28286.1 hypothetical protein, variant 3 [Blastomyces dermatitidis ATCC 26199]